MFAVGDADIGLNLFACSGFGAESKNALFALCLSRSLLGGLLGGLVSGWTWGFLGGELTFVLSSVYALIGLVLVFVWIHERPLGEPLVLRDVDTSDIV